MSGTPEEDRGNPTVRVSVRFSSCIAKWNREKGKKPRDERKGRIKMLREDEKRRRNRWIRI